MIDRHCHNIYTVRQIMRLFDTIAKSKVKINMIQRIHDEKVTLYQDFSLKGMIINTCKIVTINTAAFMKIRRRLLELLQKITIIIPSSYTIIITIIIIIPSSPSPLSSLSSSYHHHHLLLFVLLLLLQSCRYLL